MSLRLRIGVLAALGVGIAVALTALAGYLTVANQIQHSLDEGLLQQARQMVGAIEDPSQLENESSEALLAADLRAAYVFGSRVQSTRPEPPIGEPEVAVATGAETQSIRTANAPDGESMRVAAVRAAPRLALVLAQPTAPTDAILQQLKTASIVAGGLGIALAAWAGFSIAQTGLRPVVRLTEASERVAETGRLDPIEVEGTDEIARLSHSFNAMLAAVRESQRRQHRLVADAGHELRTPLTSMRTNIDLLAQSDEQGGLSDRDRKALIADVRAQAEELTQLVGDLVELSREDPPEATFETMDLADVVRDAVSRVRRRAPNVSFSVDLHPWTVRGDSTMLDRAVTNLLDNAAKYSPAQGIVTVALSDGTLEVTDEGPGISADDLPHVFERFYRSSEARGLPGSGLGLAIVRAAAERHGGTVTAASPESGGTVLTMTLPGTSEPVPTPET